MTESKLHRTIKNGVATALLQDGFNARTEYRSPLEDEGILDVYAERNGEQIKVKVINTHVPNWLLIKLGTNHKSQKMNKSQSVNMGFTIQYEVFEKIKQISKQNNESRSHYVSRILSAYLEKTQRTEATN